MLLCVFLSACQQSKSVSWDTSEIFGLPQDYDDYYIAELALNVTGAIVNQMGAKLFSANNIRELVYDAEKQTCSDSKYTKKLNMGQGDSDLTILDAKEPIEKMVAFLNKTSADVSYTIHIVGSAKEVTSSIDFTNAMVYFFRDGDIIQGYHLDSYSGYCMRISGLQYTTYMFFE